MINYPWILGECHHLLFYKYDMFFIVLFYGFATKQKIESIVYNNLNILGGII